MLELDSQAQEGGPHSLRGWGSQFYAAFSAGNGGEEWIMMVLWRWGSRCLPAGPSAQPVAIVMGTTVLRLAFPCRELSSYLHHYFFAPFEGAS